MIQGLVGVEDTQPHDKYLRLPIVIGRNKNKVFVDIIDRVWKRVQG